MRYSIIAFLLISVLILPLRSETTYDLDNTYSLAMQQRLASLEQRQVENEVFIGTLTVAGTLGFYFSWSYMEKHSTEMEDHDIVVRKLCKTGAIALPVAYILKKTVSFVRNR